MKKKYGCIKLNQLDKVEMSKREQGLIIGGTCCGCGCHGPSSDDANYKANYYAGYSQSSGGNVVCASWGSSSTSSTC